MFKNAKIFNYNLKIIFIFVYISSFISSIYKIQFNLVFVFFVLLLAFIIFKNLEQFDFDKINIYLMKYLPVFHYIFFFSYRYVQQQDIFWDGQLFYFYILCASGNFTEKYFGIELSRTNFYTCPESSGISPLYGVVNLNFNPFYSSVVLFILLISIFLYFYFKLEIKDMVITSFLLISSSFEFLIFSLNIDILILFTFLVFFINFRNVNLIFWLVIISLFAQLKIYPIGVLFGLALLFLLKKNYKEMYKTLLFLLINLGILFKFYYLGSGYVPVAESPTTVFGLYADYLTYLNVPLNNSIPNSYLLAGMVFVVILILIILNRIDNHSITSSDYLDNLFLVFYPLVFIINIFANYGYKFSFNFFLIFIFLKISINSNLKIFYISTLFFIPIINFMGSNYNPGLLNTLYFFHSRILFYILNVLFLTHFIKTFNKIFKKNYQ